MRIVKAGFCSYSELGDGTLNMDDVWRMNDWLDVIEWAESKLQEKAEREAKRK